MADSRQFVPQSHEALVERQGSLVILRAPAPGWWREGPPIGALVCGGSTIGLLEQLAVLHQLRAPADARGIVVPTDSSSGPARARRAVERGSVLLTLDPEGLGASAGASAGGPSTSASATGMVFRAPSAGRFYWRAAPDKPAFVEVGQTLARGQTLGVLEVMKTFTRVHFDDPSLPERVRVARIAVRDQDEVDAGTILLELEPA